jgi:signal transduction histidine kinase
VDEARRQEFYRVMLNDSDRLLSTIEQVLQTGRVGPSNRVLNSSAVELNGLITECVDRARALHDLEPESLDYWLGAPVKIMGDPTELRAAVSNLLENAIKYSGNNINIRIEISEVDGRHIWVRVRDKGIGIPKAELKRIFKRFYRIPGITATRLKGTGLGLYIVRSVAKRHGGRAWAESEGPGRGSTFVLQLPVMR